MNGMSRYIKNNCKHLLRNLFMWVFFFYFLVPVLKLQNLKQFYIKYTKQNRPYAFNRKRILFSKKPKKLENNNILTIDKKFRKKNQHFNLPSL